VPCVCNPVKAHGQHIVAVMPGELVSWRTVMENSADKRAFCYQVEALLP
jgi:hypothetical protein